MTASYEIDEQFVAFVSVYERGLRRTAYLLCGDWHRAEDAVQSALIKVYVNWTKIQRRDAVPAYARRAVVTAVMDEHRRPWRRETAVDVLPDHSPDDSATEAVADRLLLRQALAALPARQRAVVILRYVDDLDIQETASAMKCQPGTVTSTAVRALASMKSFLVRHGVVRGTGQSSTTQVLRGEQS